MNSSEMNSGPTQGQAWKQIWKLTAADMKTPRLCILWLICIEITHLPRKERNGDLTQSPSAGINTIVVCCISFWTFMFPFVSVIWYPCSDFLKQKQNRTKWLLLSHNHFTCDCGLWIIVLACTCSIFSNSRIVFQVDPAHQRLFVLWVFGTAVSSTPEVEQAWVACTLCPWTSLEEASGMT